MMSDILFTRFGIKMASSLLCFLTFWFLLLAYVVIYRVLFLCFAEYPMASLAYQDFSHFVLPRFVHCFPSYQMCERETKSSGINPNPDASLEERWYNVGFQDFRFDFARGL